MYLYELVYCTEDSEIVVDTFESEFSDLTVNDERAPISVGSQEYIRGIESN